MAAFAGPATPASALEELTGDEDDLASCDVADAFDELEALLELLGLFGLDEVVELDEPLLDEVAAELEVVGDDFAAS